MELERILAVKDGVIKGIIDGAHGKTKLTGAYAGLEPVKIPTNIQPPRINDRIQWYNKQWERIPDCKLIDAGLMDAPEGMIRDGDRYRPPEFDEVYIHGIKPLPEGMKISDENGVKKVVPMSDEEKVGAGLLSKEEYNKGQREKRIQELQTFLAGTDYIGARIAEGSQTAEHYADIIAQRNNKRTELKTLLEKNTATT